MAVDTDKYWIYKIAGKNIQLYQLTDGARVESLAGYNKRIPWTRGSELNYPLEAITNGMKIQGTAFIKTFVNNDPNELDSGSNPTLAGVDPLAPGGSYNELNTHVNVSRLLSLAVVDYLKAMVADMGGKIDVKEYYMKEFYKKLSDNESNKRKMTFSAPPSNPYAII